MENTMKKYKLLRDLPTFKAGEEFCLNDKGNLVYDKEHDIVAYSKQTLEKFPDILIDWFEEIEGYKRWRGGIGEIYWWFDTGDGRSYNYIENRDKPDNNNYEYGNYFKTEAEAEKCGEYLKALQTIKDGAKGFEPDWEYPNQKKWYGCYDFEHATLEALEDDIYKTQGTVYFKTEDDVKESFKKHYKEWLTVLGVEEAKNETN